jgi:L-gulonolactone oxidase
VRRRWTNWARNVRSSPSEWHTPSSESEVADLVRSARSRKQALRVVGAGHSWSAIAAPEQIGVSLDHHAGIVSQEGDLVTVKAGTRLKDFLRELAVRGRTLPIVGSIAEQSLAGAIATGTHGSSLVHGNLASLVERMRLIDGRGTAHDLTGDRLVASRVHLGALGIVTELTFRTCPAFLLAEVVEGVPVESVAAQLHTIARSADYVKVWWMPHTKHACIFRYERVAEVPAKQPDPARQRWVDDKIMHAWIFPAILRLGRIPRLTQLVSPMIGRGLVKPRRVGPSPLMLSTPYPTRHRETEAALPLAAAPEAFDRLVRMIERDRLTVNFIAEARFVPSDPAWMSPAHGVDTMQLGAYCYGPRSDAYFAAFWREMGALNARPHWGKEMDQDLASLRALYPRIDNFRALRDELDPDRVFGSAFHTRILGA